MGDQGGTNDGGLTLYDSSGNGDIFLRGAGYSYLNGGDVGIGTSSPLHKLHVHDGSIFISDADSTSYVFIGDSASGGAGTYGYLKWDFTNDKLMLGTSSGGDTVTILESGSVGIGTTSPTSLLHTYGTSEAGAVTDAGAKTATLRLDSSNVPVGGGGAIEFGATGKYFAAIKGHITNSGNNGQCAIHVPWRKLERIVTIGK